MNVRASWLLYWLSTVLIIGLVGAVPKTHAQTSDRPGQLAHNLQPLATVATLQLPALNIARLRATDRQRPADEPLRFAEPARVQITPGNSGTWERSANATAVWRLHITAPNALSINLGFGRYHMPANSRLFVYTPDYRSVLGPYTAADNARHGQLWTPILPGSSVVLELSGPAAEIEQIDLELSAVNQGYTAFGLPRTNAPDSGSCNVDVICPEGDIWQPEIRSVAIYTVMGMYSCTGALINNTAQDHKPLFLTAYHCVSDQARAASVVTYWNYQSLICRTGLPSNGDSPASLPSQALSGSSLRSQLPASDFALLELDDAVPGSFNPHWAGWDRRAVEFPAVVTIHHPQGHEKRISLENDPTTTTSHGQSVIPGDGTHLRITDWDVGTTEGGSSGAPLFNPDHHIIGQLHGGYAYCDNSLSDWYGRLSYSWAGGGSAATRLSNWLDPLDAGVLMLDGLDALPDFSLDVAPAAPSLCAGTSTSYTIALSASTGYSSTVTLSAPDLPAGLATSFDPPALVPPGTSVITVSAAPSAAAGPTAITILGTAPATGHAQTVTVTIATAIPAPPPLSEPANTSSGLPLRPTLSWDSVPESSDYQLELASDVNFTSPEFSVQMDTTSYTPDLDLAAATPYFWRVRASNGCGAGAYSTVFQFRTAGTTPLYLPLITR